MRVEIPYKPRKLWKEVIHPALDQRNRAVLVCHRRFGKTVGAINELIKKAVCNKLRSPQYAYIAPYRNQAKRIAWNYLLYYTGNVPDRKVNSSDLYVELPSRFRNSPGARIYVMGADYPDALRGMYLDGVILDEFAQMRPELYGEVLVPALSDRNGFVYIIGTPKGQNAFYERYLTALKDDSYFVCCYRADETGIIPEEKLEEMKREMTDTEIRQELLCDFTASASNIVIPIDLVTEAANRTISDEAVADSVSIMGVDVARFGDDDTIITHRKGLACYPQIKLHGLNTMEVASAVASHYWRIKPNAIIVDAGAMGAGVIDRLRQMGMPNVMEVNFGGSAIDSARYANIRAEMYFKILAWLKAGGCIPNDTDLKSELTVTEYKFNNSGKIILQPKEQIKELTGRSPDRADSLALTFAVPINKPIGRKQVLKANTDYKLF